MTTSEEPSMVRRNVSDANEKLDNSEKQINQTPTQTDVGASTSPPSTPSSTEASVATTLPSTPQSSSTIQSTASTTSETTTRTTTAATTTVKPTAFCDDLDQEPVAEVIESCTTSIKSTKNYRLIVNASVDPVKWETFTKNLKTIDGVHVMIENSPIVKLAFPALEKISSPNGDFIIKNNQELTEVSIVVKDEMSQQNFKIENNPNLTISTLSIPSVKIGKDFVVADNNAMTEIGTTSVTHLSAGNLLVMNNKALKAFQLLSLKAVEISGDVNITKNAKLDTILIGIQGVLSTVKFPRLTVMQNTKLQFIHGVLTSTQLKIRGNPALMPDKLKSFQGEGNDIQPEGECIFDEKISNLDDLHICKIVGSDLELADNVQGTAAGTNITEITGNVNLGNAKPDQVDFLQNAKTIGGSITSSDCTFPEELFGHSVVIRPVSPCPTKATPPVKTTTTKSPSLTIKFKPEKGSPSTDLSQDGSETTVASRFWTAETHVIIWSAVGLLVLVAAIVIFIYCCCCIEKHSNIKKGRRKPKKGYCKSLLLAIIPWKKSKNPKEEAKKRRKERKEARKAAKRKEKRTVVVGRPSVDAQEILRVKSNRDMAPPPIDLRQPDDPPLDPTQFVHKRIIIDAHPPIGPLRHPSPGDGVETSLKDIKFVEDEIHLADMGTDVEEYNESPDIVFVAIPKRDENTIFVDDTQDDTPPPRRNRRRPTPPPVMPSPRVRRVPRRVRPLD